MGLVVDHIRGIVIQVVQIPVDCTYLCQPIDVGINNNIKTRLHELCDVWIADRERIGDLSAKEPSCRIVVEWLIQDNVCSKWEECM